MASKEVKEAIKAKAKKERGERHKVSDQLIEHFKETEEFSFRVEVDIPGGELPDGPFRNSFCDQQCVVTVAGKKAELTIDQMLNIHEMAAVACGLPGCKSRGIGVSDDLSCDGAIARRALGFLVDQGLVYPRTP